MMLFVDPAAVDMTRAVREYASGTGVLTRKEGGPGVVSKSGVLGDPTRRDAGEGPDAGRDARSRARSKTSKPSDTRPCRWPGQSPARPRRATAARVADRSNPAGDRLHRRPGARHPADRAALRLALGRDGCGGYCTTVRRHGDMRHPDGTIERGRKVIMDNRAELFTRKEYRGSVHAVQLERHPLPRARIRHRRRQMGAAADAIRRGPAQGRGPTPDCARSFCANKTADWQIEAWRYTDRSSAETTTAPPHDLQQARLAGPGRSPSDLASRRCRMADECDGRSTSLMRRTIRAGTPPRSRCRGAPRKSPPSSATPRRCWPIGAQSSLTGGATPMGDVVLSTEKLTRVLDAGPSHIRVEAGVPVTVIQETLAATARGFRRPRPSPARWPAASSRPTRRARRRSGTGRCARGSRS